MLRCTTLVLALVIAASWYSNQAMGQVPSNHQASGSPGIWYRGEFFGYQPGVPRPSPAGTMPPVPGAGYAAGRTNATPSPTVRVTHASLTENVVAEPSVRRSADVGMVDARSAFNENAETSCQDICFGNPAVRGSAEYLLWWTRGMHTPALASTGVLDELGTQVLFGDSGLTKETRSGGRFTLGMWLDPCGLTGLDVTYLALGNQTDRFVADGSNFPVLARPFFNLDPQNIGQDARFITAPDLLTGVLEIEASTEFQTVEILLRRATWASCWSRVDWSLGYRGAKLKDRVRVDEVTETFFPEASFVLFDQFDTSNTFHGGQLGISFLGHTHPCWSLELSGKVALGRTQMRTRIAGQTAVDGVVSPQGLLAQSTNIGSHTRDETGFLSEVGVTLRRQLHHGLTATFGYRLVHWNDVFRAGEQIDFGMNATQIPPGQLIGEARPAFPSNTNSFWAQGIHFGLEYLF